MKNKAWAFRMKNMALLIAVTSIMLVLVSCGLSSIEVPDLSGVNESLAEKTLTDKGLLPSLEYVYSDTVKEHSVLYTDPASGEKVPKDTKVTVYVSKGPSIEIPDLSGVNESLAEKTLMDKGLLPIMEYDYSDEVKEGYVIETKPASGEKVPKDTKVTVYVSKGPIMVEAVDGTITWEHIDSDYPDDWEFGVPFVYEDTLYIECLVNFGTSFDFVNKGFGNAKIGGSYGTSVPLSIKTSDLEDFTSNYHVEAGEQIDFVIVIPLGEDVSKRPTKVCCELVISIDGKQKPINADFDIVW